MPFQIHNGKAGKRLILVDELMSDTATVVLDDGTAIIVAPSSKTANGYPGIRAKLETVPKPIVRVFRHEQRIAIGRLRSLGAHSPVRGQHHDAIFNEAIDEIKQQPLLCAGIVIGRELTLVLPKSMFARHNRFVLPAVRELVVPVSLASR